MATLSLSSKCILLGVGYTGEKFSFSSQQFFSVSYNANNMKKREKGWSGENSGFAGLKDTLPSLKRAFVGFFGGFLAINIIIPPWYTFNWLGKLILDGSNDN